jgi:transmembrane protein TMEM260 (protein O-mannosyltransferase)
MTLDRFWSGGIRAWPVALAAGIGALACYLPTLSRFVSTADPAEFQTLARTGGVAHAGYPTYVMMLRLVGSLPISTLPWRANALTACFGAVAIALLAYVAQRWTGRATAALVAAAAFAMTVTMWNESTLAGVHAPTLALDAILLLLALHYAWRPSLAVAGAAAFLFGLGITCHLTVLGLGLPLLLSLVAGVRRSPRRARHLALVMIAFVIGLSPFVYTIAMDRPEQPMNYLYDTLEPGQTPFSVERPELPQRLERLLWLLSGEQYLGVDHRTLPVLAHRAVYVASVLFFNELPFGVLFLALAGLLRLLRAPGEPRWIVGAWFASAVLLAGIGGTELTLHYFFLPCTWVLCLGLAVALGALSERSMPLGRIAMVAVLAMPVLRHRITEPPAPLARFAMWRHVWAVSPGEWSPFREDRRYDSYGRGVMQRLPPRATVIGARWNEAVTLRYFVFGEPLRPDVQVLYAGMAPPRLARQWRAAVAAGRPAYMTYLPGAEELPGARLDPVWDSGWRQLWRIEMAPADTLAAR